MCGVDERLEAAVEVGDRIRPVPPARPGPCTEDGLTATTSTPARRGRRRTPRARPRASSARRRTGARRGAASPRVPTVPARLPERRRGGGEHDAADAGAGGGADGDLGAADVDVEERRRVGRAHRVDAGHVVDERAARHPAGERRPRRARRRAPPRRRAPRARRPASSERASATTSSPRSSSRRSSACPMKPLPPVTKTRAIVAPSPA